MVQVKWTNLAIEDLKGIYDYISRNSVRFEKI
jgi:plasmid stabilization system protein ParE